MQGSGAALFERHNQVFKRCRKNTKTKATIRQTTCVYTSAAASSRALLTCFPVFQSPVDRDVERRVSFAVLLEDIGSVLEQQPDRSVVSQAAGQVQRAPLPLALGEVQVQVPVLPQIRLQLQQAALLHVFPHALLFARQHADSKADTTAIQRRFIWLSVGCVSSKLAPEGHRLTRSCTLITPKKTKAPNVPGTEGSRCRH